MNALSSQKTLTELSGALRSGELSCVELMESTLDRLEASQKILNAATYIAPREALIDAARQSQARIDRNGDSKEVGPLEGVPLGVKDLEDVQGMPTSMGSRLFAGQVAKQDSTQVARLRAAGAIPVCKTNTPEFGFTAISKNLPFGTTRSPWNTDRTPGGSSGGSAALLVADILPLVTSSDGGGSIRIPASFTGAFGHKPSYGRVPRGPFRQWGYNDLSVYGPLTKTVADAALFLDVVAGSSPCDPNTLPDPGCSYQDVVTKDPEPLRIGFSLDLGFAVVQSDVAAAFEQSVDLLRELGHEVAPLVSKVDSGPPNMGGAWGFMGSFENASFLHRFMDKKDDMTRAFARGLDEAWAMTPERFGEVAVAREQLNRWCGELFEHFDLLVTPTVPYDPPPAGGPFPVEIEGKELPEAAVASFTIPFNMSWHPAASLRMGLSKRGLPMGFQVVGPRHRDDLVLQLSAQVERARPWHPEWPELVLDA